MKIYIVQGSCGEYSDHLEWLIKAFKNENKAKECVELCSAEHRRIVQDCENKDCNWTLDNDGLKAEGIEPHKHDPKYRKDYLGCNYNLLECEMDIEE